ncbi:MAG: hypothetical protein VX871_05175, partial [Pseudomonadota bacterium]|nr:hypothetical protein [Pseudomonadota bacterium]
WLALGAGYLAWWTLSARPPAASADLAEVAGTLLKVEDISRSADSVHPLLDILVALPDGSRTGLYIRNRHVTLKQFRVLVGSDVRARYQESSGIVYEFFAGDRQLIDYQESYLQAQGSYTTLVSAARIVFAGSVVCAGFGLFGYWRARRRMARDRN